jgi:hypothetical protein
MTTQITSDLEQIAARLNAFGAELKRPVAGMKAATRAVGGVLKKHFRTKNQVLNKKGWKKQGFWKQLRDSVQETFTDTSGSVVVNDPRFLQKVYGGTITPKTGKALAIPLKAEFYGVNPATFAKDRFFLLKSKKGKNLGFLAEKQADGSLKLCYVLRRSVTQAADPTALPPLAELEAAAMKALSAQLERELKKTLRK